MWFCSERTPKHKQDGDGRDYVLKGLSDRWVPSRLKKSKNKGRGGHGRSRDAEVVAGRGLLRDGLWQRRQRERAGRQSQDLQGTRKRR